ncbi:MAG TPA: hypothetical protein VK943_15700 [Arenibaculum sp.]|nr:hypothetical protein [Arenibaculum sp.]
MADITQGFSSNRSAGSGGLATGLITGLRTFVAGLREGAAAHRRYSALSAMSGSDLRARGLTRAEIGREAMFPTWHYIG